MHFIKFNENPTNAVILQFIDTRHSPTCFGTLKCHNQGIKRDPAEIGGSVVEIRDILTLTPPSTIHSFHLSLISTTLGTFLSRITIDSLMIAF
jgi:hypothetical protein